MNNHPAGPAVPYVGANQQTAGLRLKSYGLSYTSLERHQAIGSGYCWKAETNKGTRYVQWDVKSGWTMTKTAPCAHPMKED